MQLGYLSPNVVVLKLLLLTWTWRMRVSLVAVCDCVCRRWRRTVPRRTSLEAKARISGWPGRWLLVGLGMGKNQSDGKAGCLCVYRVWSLWFFLCVQIRILEYWASELASPEDAECVASRKMRNVWVAGWRSKCFHIKYSNLVMQPVRTNIMTRYYTYILPRKSGGEELSIGRYRILYI